ncbi:hypothetical protein NBRC3280_3177 [Acetobacter pasteurianus NBRC 3280]|uniref:TonB-dependent receptor n=1 Tax=Acetobacter pasteurianus NBRC 3278 TaxID=1226660 RepID=A0A401X876_ACEPA|nr:hypothetical protein [Acetobacter pasteurianus]GCD60562.1 hypothetical protein NBRC3277_3137 [Acetobacter pasteurianus NBRC 3277]GCD64122.1 hypothetical protein NBRC3278_3215 [Acetobacter pasteurianus NBRC 3278]GCD70542.1 hypothetical protein NBRC3280_3177 [Acetobacter pasteurianus NBRC 3280]
MITLINPRRVPTWAWVIAAVYAAPTISAAQAQTTAAQGSARQSNTASGSSVVTLPRLDISTDEEEETSLSDAPLTASSPDATACRQLSPESGT